jgi:hypothetical protein
MKTTPTDEHLLRRIQSEFHEMPGLRLTRDQARRLWGLDADTCERMLQRLVDANFLACHGDGRYGRGGERSDQPPMRMAKVEHDRLPRRRAG